MPYLRLLRTPRAAIPAAVSGLSALPLGMFGLGVLLLVREQSGSMAEAGAVSGAVVFGEAFGMVAQGRLFDRFGQTVPLLVAAAASLVSMGGLVLASRHDAAAGIMTALAITGGAAIPSTTTCMRVLWPILVKDPYERQAAYAAMGVMFQLSFMVGPPLVSILVTFSGPPAAVLGAAVIACGSAATFAMTPASRSWRPAASESARSADRFVTAGLVTLLVASIGLGAVNGSGLVAVSSLAIAIHAPALAGLLLGCPSVGEIVGGIVTGARSWNVPIPVRLIAGQLTLAICWLMMALFPTPLILAPLLFVVGVATAPQSIATSSMLDEVASKARLATSYTVMLGSMLVANAIGTSVAGWLSETLRPNWIFGFVAMLGGAATAYTVLTYRNLPASSRG